MKTNTLKRFPVSTGGQLMHYPWGDPTWVDNDPIFLTLTLQGTERGRSAAYFVWTDPMGRRWPMFLTDMVDLLRTEDVKLGKVSAMWQVRKRGANYGIALAVTDGR